MGMKTGTRKSRAASASRPPPRVPGASRSTSRRRVSRPQRDAVLHPRRATATPSTQPSSTAPTMFQENGSRAGVRS